MGENYELQVTCKNPHCLKAFPLEVMPPDIDGPMFSTHKEATNALAGMIQAERRQKEKNLQSIIHDRPIADTEHTIHAQGCPYCNRMYAYSAEEIFIQMPPESS